MRQRILPQYSTRGLFPRTNPALRVSLTTFAIGSSWIIFSDRLLQFFAGSDATLIVRYQSLKGIAFYAAFAIFLYFSIRKAVNEKRELTQSLRDALADYQNLLDSVDGIVWEAEPDFRLTFLSKQAERLLGYPVQKWLENPMFWPSIIHPDDVERVTELHDEASRRRKSHVLEYRAIAADGRIVWIRNIVSVTVREGAIAKLSGIMFDVTESRQAMNELAQAKRDAEITVQMRDEFLSVASHELRTPLTALKVNVQSLQRRIRNVSEEKLPQFNSLIESLDRTNYQFDRFSHLVENLLDVTRITGNRLILKRETCDLSEVVRDCASRLDSEIRRAGCEVRWKQAESLTGQWDPTRIDQVVTNLLSNAAKYASGSPIEISVSRVEDRAELLIRDFGIGIDPAHHTRIFERFEQIDHSAPRAGLGLGLYITRNIVDAHGGHIELQSDIGKGCAFRVELPLQ